ncbi:DUF5134 domain-containing protein [Streptomyces sp. NPDC005805]|uniref:DUF5134 domain-containing protein n=1 Tax=Streptomyces sp. NPDC005805 TaxID=3157068 RepID=UPI0033FE74D0
MHGPTMSGWLLMTLCLGTGAYCLARMRDCHGEARESAGGEALMAFGMAAMAVPAAVLAPPPWQGAAYAAVFGAAGLRVLWTLRRCGRPPRHLHHLVGCLAMVHMALAMAGPGRGGGHPAHEGAASAPLVTAVLLVYFTVYVLRAGARLVPAVAGPSPGGAAAGHGGGELVPACRLAMATGMLAMLLTL